MVINHGFFIFSFLQSILRITPRDRFLLRSISQLFLTNRLVWEVSQQGPKPFTTYEALYQRLGKLRKAGFVKRQKMLSTGEYAYYLAPKGIQWLRNTEGMSVPPRATRPVSESMQRHEYEVSRYWIRFFHDCARQKIPILNFWRDGEFTALVGDKSGKVVKLVPDGTLAVLIKGKVQVFFLEMDRGTQTSGIESKRAGVFRKKLQRYHSFFPKARNHPFFKHWEISRFRVVTVSRSNARLEYLQTIAKEERIGQRGAFTSWQRLLEKTEGDNQKWKYRRTNFVSGQLYSFPNRAPPQSILS